MFSFSFSSSRSSCRKSVARDFQTFQDVKRARNDQKQRRRASLVGKVGFLKVRGRSRGRVVSNACVAAVPKSFRTRVSPQSRRLPPRPFLRRSAGTRSSTAGPKGRVPSLCIEFVIFDAPLVFWSARARPARALARLGWTQTRNKVF